VLLSPDNVRNYCLGQIGRDIVCLLQAGMYDEAKHEKHKLEIQEPCYIGSSFSGGESDREAVRRSDAGAACSE
jgi:hypothetical protein